MLNLFKSKPSSYLGIDIGTKSIKLFELENIAGRPRLVTYGIVEIDSQVAQSDESDHGAEEKKKIASAISALLQKTGANSMDAVAALPNFSVFSSIISLPDISEKKIAEAVQWEAKKFVPMPIENVVLDWKIIDKCEKNIPEQTGDAEDVEKDKDKQKNQDLTKNFAKCDKVLSILLTAAPKHLVERYIEIFKLCGIKLLSLETESFALSRSLIGSEDGSILIADIGSLTTDVTVVRKGVPVFSRSINVGGKTITQSISDSLGISEDRAEQFKRDSGVGTMRINEQEQARQTSGVEQIIERTFSSVVNEIKYTLDLQKTQANQVEKILITGGSSFLPSIDSYLSKSLGIKVFIANPWARVSYPRDIEDVLNDISPRMAVAIGLAMREIE